MSDHETTAPDDFESARGALESATTLPPMAYHSPEFFRKEIDNIFMKEWFCAGHVSDAPSLGDYYSFDFAGEPLVVARGQDDEIHVLSRVCRHKAMELVKGSGNTRMFVCPYHKWTYALDGALRGAPHMEKSEIFDRGKICLPRLKTEIWQGFIFANFDLNAPSLASRLGDVEALTSRYRMADLKMVRRVDRYLECNWKIFLENSNDFYHHLGLHATTLEPFIPTKLSYFDPLGGVATAFHAPIAEGGNGPLTGGFPFLPDLNEEEKSKVINVGVYPNISLTYEPQLVNVLVSYPIDATRILSIDYLLLPKKVAQAGDFQTRLDQFNEEVNAVVAEDLAGCADVQRGVTSRLAQKGPLSHLEASTRDANKWVLDRVLAN